MLAFTFRMSFKTRTKVSWAKPNWWLKRVTGTSSRCRLRKQRANNQRRVKNWKIMTLLANCTMLSRTHISWAKQTCFKCFRMVSRSKLKYWKTWRRSFQSLCWSVQTRPSSSVLQLSLLSPQVATVQTNFALPPKTIFQVKPWSAKRWASLRLNHENQGNVLLTLSKRYSRSTITRSVFRREWTISCVKSCSDMNLTSQSSWETS